MDKFIMKVPQYLLIQMNFSTDFADWEVMDFFVSMLIAVSYTHLTLPTILLV